jgi:peptide/nickel transport system substrate-binding protein
MKRYSLILLVFSSVLSSPHGYAASRPHYGGTLRIASREVPQTLDPSAQAVSPNLSHQVFETLVKLDERGRPQPLLATSWESEAGSQRWRFLLRGGVNLHDGSLLDASTVTASLRAANPGWKVFAMGEAVMIQTEFANPELPSELALSRNSIIRRAKDGRLSGTGPFMIAQWIPSKHLTLKANDGYWNGRPFLDTIEVEFGKGDREQKMLLDLAKAEVAELAPESIRGARSEGRTIITSQPQELLALVFSADAGSDDEAHARSAMAEFIDSSAINNVVFQGGGEPSAALVPNWVSGYGFIFSSSTGTLRSRQQRLSTQRLSTWTLAYDASDPTERVVAERILLNARDIGINLQLITSGSSTVRLVRIPLPSLTPQLALSELARTLQLPRPKYVSGSVTDLYSAESALLQSHRVVPLVHLRNAVALRPEVHNWHVLTDGDWQLCDVWLWAERP